MLALNATKPHDYYTTVPRGLFDRPRLTRAPRTHTRTHAHALAQSRKTRPLVAAAVKGYPSPFSLNRARATADGMEAPEGLTKRSGRNFVRCRCGRVVGRRATARGTGGGVRLAAGTQQRPSPLHSADPHRRRTAPLIRITVADSPSPPSRVVLLIPSIPPRDHPSAVSAAADGTTET